MNEEKEIYSMVYGGWKKTDVQDLVVIRCKHCDHCSLFKNGICAAIPRIFSPSCPFGHSIRSRGYSQRAGSYLRWISDIRKRPSYNALKESPNSFIAIVDDYIMTPLYAGIYWDDKENRWKGPGFGSVITSMPITEWTPKKLKALYDYVPYTMFDCKLVKDWKENRSKWFTQMKEIAPDVITQFLKSYPNVEITVSHIGREAKVNSLRDGVVLMDNSKNLWEKCGDELICRNYKGVYFGLFGENKLDLVVTCQITPSMTYKITSEDMVDDNVVFVT